MTTDGIGPLAAALAKAQSEFGAVTRDKKVTVTLKSGGSYTFAYAPLDQILGVVRAPLAKNGLALVQLLDTDALVTVLIHDSGASLEARTPVPSTGDIQAYGSAITYLRRYAIQALLGIAAEDDDDGNRGAGNQAAPVHQGDDADDDSDVTLALLGRIQKTGKAVKGTATRYKGEWFVEEAGHAIGFRLNIDGEDKAIPQVRVMGGIGEALYLGHPDFIGSRITIKGHLYNVTPKRRDRRSYYRLVIGEHPANEFIETPDVRIPNAEPDIVSPLREDEPKPPAIAPGQVGFDLQESLRIDAEAVAAESA